MDGTLVTGEGAGAEFVAATRDALADAVGFRPYPGTLNLSELETVDSLPRRTLDDDLGDPHCEGVHLRPCTVAGVRATVIRPLVPGYPEGKVELLAPVRLRELFAWGAGASVPVGPPDDAWSTAGPRAVPTAVDSFDAVVFDLDGTLLDLAVDWPAVHAEIEAEFGAYLDKPVTEHGENELFEVAAANDVFEDLAALIAAHEDRGAEGATPLAGVESLDDIDVPVGICTANSLGAAERALDRFGAAAAVDATVARTTVRPGKPHPAPLLACLDRLDVEPGNALFVGDQPSDAEAAVRAGTSFLNVAQLWPPE